MPDVDKDLLAQNTCQLTNIEIDEALKLPDRVALYEKKIIETELKKNLGAIDPTFKGLGIPRKTLYDKMKKHDIDRKDFKPA